MINPCVYYSILKSGKDQLFLTSKPKEVNKGFNLHLTHEEPEKGEHLWMLKPADLEGIYYMFNCSNGLVL